MVGYLGLGLTLIIAGRNNGTAQNKRRTARWAETHWHPEKSVADRTIELALITGRSVTWVLNDARWPTWILCVSRLFSFLSHTPMCTKQIH
jgi:hypothetical protein